MGSGGYSHICRLPKLIVAAFNTNNLKSEHWFVYCFYHFKSCDLPLLMSSSSSPPARGEKTEVSSGGAEEGQRGRRFTHRTAGHPQTVRGGGSSPSATEECCFLSSDSWTRGWFSWERGEGGELASSSNCPNVFFPPLLSHHSPFIPSHTHTQLIAVKKKQCQISSGQPSGVCVYVCFSTKQVANLHVF